MLGTSHPALPKMTSIDRTKYTAHTGLLCAQKDLFVAFGADYLLVIAVAVVLSSANVIGYTKCSKQASSQLRDMARNAMTAGMTVGCAAQHLIWLAVITLCCV